MVLGYVLDFDRTWGSPQSKEAQAKITYVMFMRYMLMMFWGHSFVHFAHSLSCSLILLHVLLIFVPHSCFDSFILFVLTYSLTRSLARSPTYVRKE